MGATVEARWDTHATRSVARSRRAARRTVRPVLAKRSAKSGSDEAQVTDRLFAEFVRTRDEGLREELIRRHAYLAERVARNFISSSEPFEDITQEAYIGLVKAVDTFDPSLGNKFSTYATHKINGQIRHYLRDRTSVIRQPGWLHERSRKVARVTEKLRHKLNREPTLSEIAAEAGITEDEVQEVRRTRNIFRVASLDSPDAQGDGDEGVPLDRKRIQALRAEAAPLPVEEKVVLRQAIKKLKSIERRVIYALYYRGLSQTEVADQLNISCNYVSHILRNALIRLRQILASEEVKETHLRAKTVAQAERTRLGETTYTTDPLTKLYTLRILRERLEEEILRASRYGYEITMIALAIDDLDTIAEVHGSAQSDLVVAEVGNRLRNQVRKTDLAARIDGETFGLMLPHTGERVKRMAAERFIGAISDLQIRSRTGKLKLTASAGIAVYPLDGDSRDELLQAALDCLQTAKNAGGNCVRATRERK